MSRNLSDQIVDRLHTWGVDRVFGYPGDGINGFLGALNRGSDDIRYVPVRHEEEASLMATGHAKFTGEVGVCLATSGPGAIHLLNGLYDARLDGAPVVAIVGQQPRTAIGSDHQQEIDLQSLFKDVAKDYLVEVTAPEQVPLVIDRAIRIARARSTVTAIMLPTDVQVMDAVEPTPHEFKVSPGSTGFARPRVIPPEDELVRAAEVLNAGERVAILVGQGARGAAELVVETAETLGAGVAKALLGKDVLPDDMPFVTGAIGLLGTRPSYELMKGCDTLLMIGSSLPYSEFLPEWEDARGVQIDVDPARIGMRFPMDVNLVGDARSTLEALLPHLRPKTDRAWCEQLERSIAEWWQVLERRQEQDADPVNPQQPFWELSTRLPERAMVTCDSGSAANWYARDVRLRADSSATLSGTLATMGCALPYATAAKMAMPDRPAIALLGDGAMQMNGLGALLTVSRHWREWTDPRLVILVLHNGDLNQVTWEMRALSGDPRFDEAQDVPDLDYAAYAELVGLRGIRVDAPEQVGSAWDEAFAADRPVVIDAITDPSVPPLPPHVSREHATAMVKALLKGDSDARDVVRQAFAGKLAELAR